MDDEPTPRYVRIARRTLRSVVLLRRRTEPIDRTCEVGNVQQNDTALWTVRKLKNKIKILKRSIDR
jgi:hypothetical protein